MEKNAGEEKKQGNNRVGKNAQWNPPSHRKIATRTVQAQFKVGFDRGEFNESKS